MGSVERKRAKNLPDLLTDLEELGETELDEGVHLRTLGVQTPFFLRKEHKKRILELSEKPELLGTGEVTQRAWKRYQAYLSRVQPLNRAEFYKRLLERHDSKSIRGLAKITGEDWSRIAKTLKVLELPAPVLDFLRTETRPEVLKYFSERRLRELLALRNPVRIWDRFQAMVRKLDQSAEKD